MYNDDDNGLQMYWSPKSSNDLKHVAVRLVERGDWSILQQCTFVAVLMERGPFILLLDTDNDGHVDTMMLCQGDRFLPVPARLVCASGPGIAILYWDANDDARYTTCVLYVVIPFDYPLGVAKQNARRQLAENRLAPSPQQVHDFFIELVPRKILKNRAIAVAKNAREEEKLMSAPPGLPPGPRPSIRPPSPLARRGPAPAQTRRTRRTNKTPSGETSDAVETKTPEKRRIRLALWKRLIYMQIKQNRQDRMQTAWNRVESRKREIVRARCNATKAAKDADRVLSQPGPSGPQRRVAWVAQDVGGASESAKRDAKKKMAHEAILANAERKRAQTERQTKIDAEKMRNLQIADDMMKE